jgi:hypothetical protein
MDDNMKVYLLMARRPNFGAMILERPSAFSGGGPPFGCALMITESPERTYERNVN